MKWLALAVAALVGGAHGAAVREAASEFRVKVSCTRPFKFNRVFSRAAAACPRVLVVT